MNKLCLIIISLSLISFQGLATPSFLFSSYFSSQEYKSILITQSNRVNKVDELHNKPSSLLVFANTISNAKQAAQHVRSRYGGKILSVNASYYSGNNGYKVKLVDKQGRVLTVFVNAATGRISQL